jgi:type VI secretion system protein ImpH
MTAGDASLLNDLRERPESYSLFAALRRIEQAHPELPRLGESRKATDDPVHITQRPHLQFPAGEVAAFKVDAAAAPRVEQYSFGVFGPNGALPLHITELAYSRELQADDPTFAGFINTFQHRFASLFYRAWADSDPCTSLDRGDADLFRLYAGALLGIGPRAARDRDCVPDHAKLVRAGLFAPQPRSAESLVRIIADYFELPVEIVPFLGSWLDIAPHELCRLSGDSEYATLGLGTTLGDSTWQCQSGFEIVMGPLSIADFVNFLPGARALSQLQALVRLFTNEEWFWQVRLLLQPADIPPVVLGESGWLGWTTWLGERNATARDAVIDGSQPTAR